MESRKQASNPELRYCTEPEARVKATNDETRTIRGYGVVFNKKSHPLSMNGKRFIEVIAPEAVRGVDFSRNISLFNHNMDIPLASVESGTMRVGVDNVGVWYEADLPNSPDGENVWQNVKRGVVRGSSFQFDTAEDGDTWEVRNGILHRTVTQFAGIYEQGPVVSPAYPDTTAAQRSYELRAASLRSEGEIPSMQEINSGIVGEMASCIECLSEAITECQNSADAADNYAALDPANATLYADMKTNCLAVVAAAKTAIDSHSAIIAAGNGGSRNTDIKTQQARTAQIAAILALH